ncbi:MAG: ComEA family DNA-binding protein [Actinobacteria bacterium]|nr:MAG: ComEA family DNA-binding protein [Actinomycetota bacterium]
MIGERIQERLGAFSRRELAGIAVLAVIMVAGAGFWYVRSLPRPVTIQAPGNGSGSGSGPGAAVGAGPLPAPSAIPLVVVDVAGWVRHPGVYELHQGDRVIDAIRRAGGVRPGADVTSINLAALLTDGQQILVWKKGRTAAGAGSGSTTGSGGGSGAGGPINVNTATLDQLDSLPGIGPTLAQRIIDYREQHGPFRSVEDLLNDSGIGDARLADLKPLVTV